MKIFNLAKMTDILLMPTQQKKKLVVHFIDAELHKITQSCWTNSLLQQNKHIDIQDVDVYSSVHWKDPNDTQFMYYLYKPSACEIVYIISPFGLSNEI